MFRSLYVHFPFCETKCHYCDFYSLANERVSKNDRSSFLEALAREFQNYREHLDQPMESIFFGGGTPSMTSPEAMKKVFGDLDPFLNDQTEFTMEANPSSITPEKLTTYRKLGINRISMGVQSLRDDHLRWLGRVHSRNRALKALEEIFNAGFENVSVDLICGVPGQTTEDLRAFIEELTSFPITHLSCYLLTLAPHHPLLKELPDEKSQLEHLLFIDRELSARDFRHYEISNFAKPGKRAKHNLAYWTGKSYLGLGPSAHSYDSRLHKRWKNMSSLRRYCERVMAGESPREHEELLSSEQREIESWMLGLRLDEGVPENWFDQKKATRAQLLKDEYMEVHPNKPSRLRLTPKGFAISDQIVAELI